MQHISSLASIQPKMQSLNIDDMMRVSAAKGYEEFIVKSMVERAAFKSTLDVPKLSEMPPADIHRVVGKELMRDINGENGLHPAGFPAAYQFELRLMKNIGASLPYISLDELNSSAHQFLEASHQKSPHAPMLKECLSEKARSAASALRAFGQSDEIVSEKLRENEPLMKSGVGEKIISMIDDDRKAGEGAKVVKKPEPAKKGFFSVRLR